MTNTSPDADSQAAIFDLGVIGAGINGAGIARDAAGRGLRVLLCDMGDLASATSSASTKLIHGGLRYLETFDFRLVREALKEREVLLGLAPHIVRPLRFVLPHNPDMRPKWMIRAGLFLYDHLGGRQRLPGCRTVALTRHPMGGPLRDSFRTAFLYSDCLVDDARLVVLNALDAAERGADVRLHTRATAARRVGGLWQLTLESEGHRQTVAARAVVNATGPWAGAVMDRIFGLATHQHLRLVKGSHIVVPRLYEGDHAYILQNPDRRVVFAIPWEGDFTLIGTTEVDFTGDPADARITAAEIDYLRTSLARYFKPTTGLHDEAIVWRYAGVRPLHDDAQARASRVSRDYVLDIDTDADGRVPLLSVIGGKITTYRRLAEAALKKLAPVLGRPFGEPWTASAPLPGGDMEATDFGRFASRLAASHSWLPASLAQRYARLYGTRAERLVAGIHDVSGLGRAFGAGLYEAEIAYLRAVEWARTADDILWRRTKLGLRFTPGERDALHAWLATSP